MLGLTSCLEFLCVKSKGGGIADCRLHIQEVGWELEMGNGVSQMGPHAFLCFVNGRELCKYCPALQALPSCLLALLLLLLVLLVLLQEKDRHDANRHPQGKSPQVNSVGALPTCHLFMQSRGSVGRGWERRSLGS